MMTFMALPQVDLVDIAMVAQNMRRQDVEEVQALSRLSPTAAIRMSLKMSDEVWCARDRHGTLAVGGIRQSVLGGVGHPWLLCTDRLAQYPKQAVRFAREWVRERVDRGRVLTNIVHADNEPAQRFIAALGFEIGDPYPLGIRGGVMVRHFEMRG